MDVLTQVLDVVVWLGVGAGAGYYARKWRTRTTEHHMATRQRHLDHKIDKLLHHHHLD